jgi:hypothetical protein
LDGISRGPSWLPSEIQGIDVVEDGQWLFAMSKCPKGLMTAEALVLRDSHDWHIRLFIVTKLT